MNKQEFRAVVEEAMASGKKELDAKLIGFFGEEAFLKAQEKFDAWPTWAVLRLSNGLWCSPSIIAPGGHEECEVWQVKAETLEDAINYAKTRRARLQHAKAAAQMAREFKGEK